VRTRGDLNNRAASHRWWSLTYDASYGDAAHAGRYDTQAYIDRRNQPKGKQI